MSSTSPYPRGHSGNTAKLRYVFIRHVHQLIKLGYDRMNAAQFRTAEEPDISGELVLSMEQARDDPKSEPWVLLFAVHDDPPVQDPVRKGRRRRRVDIRLDSLEYHPRQRFSFEAKRLDDSHTVSAYLGHEGLGCFLRGEYARDEATAGMLGYVQTGEPREWASRIGVALAKSRDSYGVLKESPWRHHQLVPELEHTYRSGHERRHLACPIGIYHTLLVFC